MDQHARNSTVNLDQDDGDYNDWLEDMEEDDFVQSNKGSSRKGTSPEKSRSAKPEDATRMEYSDAAKASNDAGKDGRNPATNSVPDKPKRILGPRAKLDAARLCGASGLPVLVKDFENIPWKGKGREEEDLLLMMRKVENWAHRMYPKFRFDDTLDKIEHLGRKREVRTCVRKLMDGMPVLPEDFVRNEQDDGNKTPDYGQLFQAVRPTTSTDGTASSGKKTSPLARNTALSREDEFEEMLANFVEPDMGEDSDLAKEVPISILPRSRSPQSPRSQPTVLTEALNAQDNLHATEQMEEDDILGFINDGSTD